MTTQPLRRVFDVINGGTPTAEPENWGGDVPWATPIDLGRLNGQRIGETHRTITADGLRTGSSLVPSGSLIVSTRAPIGYVVETTTPMAFNQGCRGLVPRSEVDVRFFRYQLLVSAERLQSRGQGSTFVELSTDAIASFPLVVPPASEQRAIADYLDAETARIDSVAAARRRVAALASLRLDVNTRQRVSNDDQDKPWPRLPLRRRWQVIDCKHRTPVYQPEGYPIVSPGDAFPGRLDLSRCSRFVGYEDFVDLTEGSRRPRRGDIIYTRNASIGIASYVDVDEPFSMGQDVCLIRSTDQDQRYLSYVLTTLGMDQLEEQKIGSTFSRINVAQVLDLSVPCPSVDHQRRIADALDEASARTSAIISAAERQIGLLLERRQALITAAVTGQLEIPGVAA